MPFNPLQHRLLARYLQDQGADQARLSLRIGAKEHEIIFPKDLLPSELNPGEEFLFSLQPKELLEKKEADILKELLQELIK